jgi:hypothetical protein
LILSLIPIACHVVNFIIFWSDPQIPNVHIAREEHDNTRETGLEKKLSKSYRNAIILFVICLLLCITAVTISLHLSRTYRVNIIETHALYFVVLDITCTLLVHTIQYMVIMVTITRIYIIIQAHYVQVQDLIEIVVSKSYDFSTIIKAHRQIEQGLNSSGKNLQLAWIPILGFPTGGILLNIINYVQHPTGQGDIWLFFVVGSVVILPGAYVLILAARMNEMFSSTLSRHIDKTLIEKYCHVSQDETTEDDSSYHELHTFYTYILINSLKPKKGFHLFSFTISISLISQLLILGLGIVFYVLQQVLEKLQST